jgi:hypothetical protein
VSPCRAICEDRRRLILRIVRGSVAPGGRESLVASFSSSYAPTAVATPGLIRYHVGLGPSPDETHVIVLTFWASVDAAMRAYDGDLTTPKTLDGLAASTELHEVAYWEVDETLLRRADAAPTLLRLTFGRISQGADAAIQQELRERVRMVDGAMTEAYIGRRLIATDVEIAFVSAWTGAPDGVDLTAPVWPDISQRYTSFALELYVPVLSGAAEPA